MLRKLTQNNSSINDTNEDGMVNGVEGRIITFGRSKRVAHILRKDRKAYTFPQVLWCILALAHSYTLGGEHFGTSDGALGDILVWELSGTFDEEFVCIPAWLVNIFNELLMDQ